jgi:hypothetical protein
MSNLEYLSSYFTRKKGFENIQSSTSISRKKAIHILNSFTPQGASPRVSIRLGSVDNKVGVGYYFMEDNSSVHISTILTSLKFDKLQTFLPPLEHEDISYIARGAKINLLNDHYSKDKIMDIVKIFDKETASALIYSILSGDNLIIVHNDHTERLKFLASILNFLPRVSLSYNRLTSECAELDGNENIIGVSELPKKYRDHKKLYLPLDTIFIDLEENRIEGSGLKRAPFTDSVVESAIDDNMLIKTNIHNFFKGITESIYNNTNTDPKTMTLIERIELKLGIRNELEQSWLMGF